MTRTEGELQIPIENLIRFWEGSLLRNRLLMQSATIVLVEQTIRALRALKKANIETPSDSETEGGRE